MKDNPAESSGPTRQRRPKREEVRARLLDAAAAVFARQGFESTTLEEVAESAGFSKGAVYSNFSSKDELFFALMERRIEERVLRVDEAMSAQATLEGKTREAGEILSGVLAQDPEWQILFVEYWIRVARNQELRQRFIERREPLRGKIAQLLERQTTAFGIDPQVSSKSWAVVILALSNGLGIEGIADPGAVSPELFGQVLTYLFRGFATAADGGHGSL